MKLASGWRWKLQLILRRDRYRAFCPAAASEDVDADRLRGSFERKRSTGRTINVLDEPTTGCDCDRYLAPVIDKWGPSGTAGTHGHRKLSWSFVGGYDRWVSNTVTVRRCVPGRCLDARVAIALYGRVRAA